MNRQLRRAIDEFSRQIETILDHLVKEQVAATVRAHNGARSPRVAAPDAAAARRKKRSHRQLENATRKLYEHIRAHPHQRMELISRQIGIRTGLLQPLVKRLLAEKRVRAKGKARGTTYAVT